MDTNTKLADSIVKFKTVLVFLDAILKQYTENEPSSYINEGVYLQWSDRFKKIYEIKKVFDEQYQYFVGNYLVCHSELKTISGLIIEQYETENNIYCKAINDITDNCVNLTDYIEELKLCCEYVEQAKIVWEECIEH